MLSPNTEVSSGESAWQPPTPPGWCKDTVAALRREVEQCADPAAKDAGAQEMFDRLPQAQVECQRQRGEQLGAPRQQCVLHCTSIPPVGLRRSLHPGKKPTEWQPCRTPQWQ